MPAKKDYESTRYTAIKKLKNGKYEVWLDYGRELRPDKKTGKMKMVQVKTARRFDTLDDAKQAYEENNRQKRNRERQSTKQHVYFEEVIKEYGDAHKDLSASYIAQQQAQAKRIMAYFGNNMDVRDLCVQDIHDFYQWCREEHPPAFPKKLSNNSIEKIKCYLNQLYIFMEQGGARYSLPENIIPKTSVGDIDEFEAQIISVEQLNDMIRYALDNENDYSIFAMIGLTALAGLRRGELCGVQWGDLMPDKHLIDIKRQRCQISTGSITKLPKGGKENAKSRKQRKERYVVYPDCLITLLDYVKKQQEEYLHREVEPTDYIYMTKINLVNGYLPHPGKVSRRFSEFQTRMNKVRKKAGKEEIPELRLHDMRHTFISLCVNGGVNPFQVCWNVGHKLDEWEYGTLFTRYLHDDNHRDEIQEFIDGIITKDLTIPDMSVSKVE